MARSLKNQPARAEICILFLVPVETRARRGKREPAPDQRGAPYFFNLDIEIRSGDETDQVVEGTPVRIRRQVLDNRVWLAECHYRLDNIFDESSLARHQEVRSRLQEQLQAEAGYTGGPAEEYTVVQLQGIGSDPDRFVETRASELAHWLRSTDKALSDDEVQSVLHSRARYSDSDLTIVDWEGAIVIAEEGDFTFDRELLKIGKYQLLRYRALDQVLEESLRQLRQLVGRRRPVWLPSKYSTVRQITEQQLALVLDFEKTDQSLLLIGDWYSARVYGLAAEQFCLDSWKNLVQGRIDALKTINDTVYQDLSLSWRRLIDFAMLVGWLVLLAGYLLLFFAGLN